MNIETIRRINYLSGQSCLNRENVARDYNSFHLPLSQLHHRTLHGTGVIAGLELSIAADRLGVKVSAGAALDEVGRVILLADSGFGLVGNSNLAEPVPVLVPVPNEGARMNFFLTIEFAEEASFQFDPANPAGCKQIDSRARLHLVPMDADPTRSGVILGVVTLDGEGKVSQISPANRMVPTTTTAGLTLTRVDAGSFSTSPAAAVRPVDDGLLVSVREGDLKLSANTTTVTSDGAGQPALQVQGSLSVTGDILLGTEDEASTVGNSLAKLKEEIDQIKRSLIRTPILEIKPTTVWIHGSAARIDYAQADPYTVFVTTEFGPQRLRMAFKPRKSARIQLFVPAISQLEGRVTRLSRIFLLGMTSDEAEIYQVDVDTFGQSLFTNPNLHLQQDFTSIGPSNTFELENPWPVTGGICVSFKCRSLSDNPFQAGVVQLMGIGAEFLTESA